MVGKITSRHIEVLALLGGEEKPVHFGRIMGLGDGSLEAAADLVVMGIADRNPVPDMTQHAKPEEWYSLNDRGKIYLNLILDYASKNL